MIEKPTCKMKDLDGKPKKLMLTLIRAFSKDFNQDMGIEKTEEVMIELLDKGLIKPAYNEKLEIWYLLIYDFKLQKYKRVGE